MRSVQKVVTILAAGIIPLLGLLPMPALAARGDVNSMLNEVKTKIEESKASLLNLLGKDYAGQVKASLEKVGRDSSSLRTQVEAVDLLDAWAADLLVTVQKILAQNLPEKRDATVAGLLKIAATKAKEAEEMEARAKEASGPWVEKYRELAVAADRMARAYRVMASRQERIPLNALLAEINNGREYLACVRRILRSLQETLRTISDAQGVLEDLTKFSQQIESLHAAILKFADLVHQGVRDQAGLDGTQNTGSTPAAKTSGNGGGAATAGVATAA